MEEFANNNFVDKTQNDENDNILERVCNTIKLVRTTSAANFGS